ncbi:YdcF family protein [Candidatus Falkowbacteria bacterium]|nr:YdcF family protein [Candidatus Falkowbacteria bacterium]
MTAIKLIQQILNPIVFIFVFLIIAIILNFKEKTRGRGKILLIIVAILYYLFSTTPIAMAIISPLEKYYPPISEENISQDKITIVFLTGGYENDLLRAEKLLSLYNFYKKNNQTVQIIISGVSPFDTENDELTEFCDWLKMVGIEPEYIQLDEQSRNTFESARNLAPAIGQNPFFLLTSAYHMPRAMMAFRAFNTQPIAAVSDYKTKSGFNVLDLIPSAENLEISAIAIHEYIGIIYYKIKLFN